MDTYGWDTVFVTTIAQANKALATRASGTTLLLFQFGDEKLSIDGTFGAWQIVSGGSGRLLHLEVPITMGHMQGSAIGVAAGDAINISGVSVVVEISLTLLPPAVGSGKRELRFDLSGSATGSGPVKPYQVNDPDKRLSTMQGAILSSIVCAGLNANASEVTYVLGTVNIVPPDTNSWLTPVQSEYFYADAGDGQSGYLAVLSVTDNRDISALHQQLDPTLLTGTSSAFFALSTGMVLKNLVLPVLPDVFETSVDNFTYNDVAGIIQSKSYELPSVKYGLISYYPQVTGLSVSVNNDGVACTLNGSCDMGLNITCSFGVHTQNTLHFDPTSKSLSFFQDGPAQFTHDYDIPTWEKWLSGPLEPILDLIVRLIADGIASGIQDYTRFLTLAREPPQTVQWSGMDQFDVMEAGLAYCFYMRGTAVAKGLSSGGVLLGAILKSILKTH